MPGASNSKGWYRYGLLFGAPLNGEQYRLSIVLEKESVSGLKELTREEAEQVFRYIGIYLASKADFKNLREEF